LAAIAEKFGAAENPPKKIRRKVRQPAAIAKKIG